MAGASIEATLELWASGLREVKARLRPLFRQERMATSAGLFLDGRRDEGELRHTINGEENVDLAVRVSQPTTVDVNVADCGLREAATGCLYLGCGQARDAVPFETAMQA